MKVQDIVSRLTVLGLDETQAAVYVQLSILGPSKASDVAAALKLHRTEAYRTLQELVQRGFVTATLGRPSRFEAAPPERLFAELRSTLDARTQSLERAQSEIAPMLATLRGQGGEALSRNTFKLLQGRREIYGVLERMMREAQRSLRCVSTHEGALPMSDMAGLLDLLVERAQKGVVVRVALRTTPQGRARLAALPQVPGLTFRHLEAPRIVRYVIVDGRELLLWVVSDPSTRISSGDDVAVWTDAADFVGTEELHFEHLWAAAVPPEAAGDAPAARPEVQGAAPPAGPGAGGGSPSEPATGLR